jgi:hypothetical protein
MTVLLTSAVSRELEARIVNVKFPPVVGVPDTRPVDVFRVMPLGSAPEATE